MKQWLVILIVLLLMAAPDALCKSKRAKDADATQANSGPSPAATISPPAAATGPSGDSGPAAQTSSDPNAEANKTLDDALSKPAETLIKEAPKPQILQGQAEFDKSGAGADASNPYRLQRGSPAVAPKDPNPVLQGSASLNGMGGAASDPDLGNDELSIAWDRWRNRLLRFVQMQVQASVNSPESDEYVRPRFDRFTGLPLPKFPLGTEAWFDCEVTNDNRIARCVITQSSGFPAYDRAVINGIRALDGSQILTFPPGSRRTSVRQEAGIRTATQSNFNYYHFGDVERYNVPQGGY